MLPRKLLSRKTRNRQLAAPRELKYWTIGPLVALVCVLMSGCYLNAKLYPIEMPASTQPQLPVLNARLTGAFSTGTVAIVMPDGKVCKGPFTRIVTPAGTTANTPSSSAMQAVWDAVYGAGYYVSHVLGTSFHGAAAITGEQGNVYQVEFYRPADIHDFHVFGVAKDSAGNIYKMVVGNT